MPQTRRRRHPGPAPGTPYQAVLAAAADLPGAPTALDAELLGSALLGSVWAVSAPDRSAAVRRFVAGFRAATARNPAAAAPRAVFAALTGDADAGRAPGRRARMPGAAAAPPWSAALGRVAATGTLAYGDVYGDRSAFAATFAYADPAGGPEHAVVVAVDHASATVAEAFVIRSAEVFRQSVTPLADDPLSWYASPAPAEVAAEVRRAFARPDTAADRPDDAAGADRILITARLAALGPPPCASTTADPADADEAAVTRRFLASPEAASAGLTAPDPSGAASRDFCLTLLWRYHDGSPDDVRRWSPRKVTRLLTDWVPGHAVLDATDRALLPRVLSAWVTWAARLRALPAAALLTTLTVVEALAPTVAGRPDAAAG